jgi:hypothetical protein
LHFKAQAEFVEIEHENSPTICLSTKLMVEYDPQEKELVKTLDLKLIPFLTVLYFILLTVDFIALDKN